LSQNRVKQCLKYNRGRFYPTNGFFFGTNARQTAEILGQMPDSRVQLKEYFNSADKTVTDFRLFFGFRRLDWFKALFFSPLRCMSLQIVEVLKKLDNVNLFSFFTLHLYISWKRRNFVKIIFKI